VKHGSRRHDCSRIGRLCLVAAATAICAIVVGAPASALPDIALHGSVSVSIKGSGTVTSSPPGIDCSDSCSNSFVSNDDPANYDPVSLTATPDSGWEFADWGGDCSGGGGCTIDPIEPGGSYSVTATFAFVIPAEFALAVSIIGKGRVTTTPAGIDCVQACSGAFATDSSVTLTATPFPGWSFAGWSGSCGGTGACSVTMGGPRAVTATFAAPETSYALAVAADGGVVTSDIEGINCGQVCTTSYGIGVGLTLTAQGSPVTWGGACPPGGATCGLTMDGPKAVAAQISGAPLSRAPLAVAVAGKGSIAGAGGAIQCGSVCGAVFPVGARAELAATPDAGWLFAGWRFGACTGVSRTCAITMTGARTATATFVEVGTVFPVAVTKAGQGRVRSRPSGIDCGAGCSGSFEAGSTVTLETVPVKGWKFVRWSGSCTGSRTTCVLGMDGPKSVSATFGRIADQKAPTVKALPSTGEPGRVARLRYGVRDASGKSREWASIFRGAKRLATVRGTLDDIDAEALFYVLSWRVPRALKPQTLRFCVWAVDPSGNRSKPSCAPLHIT